MYLVHHVGIEPTLSLVPYWYPELESNQRLIDYRSIILPLNYQGNILFTTKFGAALNAALLNGTP